MATNTAARESWDERGGALWLDREQWGIVIDALIDHRAIATKRKNVNSASNSDVRADMCATLIGLIGDVASAPHTLTQQQGGEQEAQCTDPTNCRRCSEDAETPHAGIPRDAAP